VRAVDVSDSPAAVLLELQDADTAIDQLAHRRARLPERDRLEAAVRALRDWETRRDGLRTMIDTARAEITGCEHDTGEVDAHRSRLSAQLRTVIAPREAEALQHEIATLDERRSALDDRALAAMDAEASAETALSELVATESALRAEAEQADEHLRAVESDLDTELAGLVERRDAARDVLPSTVVTRYDPLRAKLGVAAARLVGARCEGCHLDLSAAELDTVRRAPAEEIPDCPQCGRLLVR
jgi:predicted  nucleic acid-binding Zn-ribbon protein